MCCQLKNAASSAFRYVHWADWQELCAYPAPACEGGYHECLSGNVPWFAKFQWCKRPLPQYPFAPQTHSKDHMPIKKLLKSTVVALAIASSGSLFAQGTPINAAAFDALVAQGPVADAATIASSTWATKIKQAGKLRLGTTQTSNLFSLLNEKDGKIRGFDAGVAELITRYILGDASKYQFAQVNSSTREQVLINNQVDMVIATYSITPARAEKISFAGPYYTSQAGVLVKANNKSIQSYADLAGQKVATQAGSTGPVILAKFAPKAVVQEFQTHQESLDALRQGRVQAYVTDYTLLLNALSLGTSNARLAGAPFGEQDPYGIGLPKGSDGVAFINGFLKKLEADGTWAKLWMVSIGQRTGATVAPKPPVLP